MASPGGKASVAWNVKVGVASTVAPLGPLSIAACGTAESSTYVMELVEQGDSEPDMSVARAEKVVEELSGTPTAIPGEVN
jgi:hypothetical protein